MLFCRWTLFTKQRYRPVGRYHQKRSAFLMVYALSRLLDAAQKEQGFALFDWIFGCTPLYPIKFTRAPVRSRFSEAGPPAFGCVGSPFASSLWPSPPGGWTPRQTQGVRLRRVNRSSRTGAHEHALFPVGREKCFSRLGPLKFVRSRLGP